MRPGFPGAVDIGNVEITIDEERVGIQGTDQFGVAAGGGHNGSGGFALEEGDQFLVVIGIVEDEIFGHELFCAQLSVQEQDFAAAVQFFQFQAGGGGNQGGIHAAGQRVGADENGEIHPARSEADAAER